MKEDEYRTYQSFVDGVFEFVEERGVVPKETVACRQGEHRPYLRDGILCGGEEELRVSLEQGTAFLLSHSERTRDMSSKRDGLAKSYLQRSARDQHAMPRWDRGKGLVALRRVAFELMGLVSDGIVPHQ